MDPIPRHGVKKPSPRRRDDPDQEDATSVLGLRQRLARVVGEGCGADRVFALAAMG
jgi:hypothetical protein